MKQAVLFLLLFIWAPVHADLIELECEHDYAKSEDGRLLEYSDSAFDLTIDMESESISSERYPNFRHAGVLGSEGRIGWSAPSEFESDDKVLGPMMRSLYYLNRYTGTLKVVFSVSPDLAFEVRGQCVKKERLF